MTANARHLSLSVEHYTPADVVEAARKTLAVIDLDPASCHLANQTVRAWNIFTREDDGLSREWSGRVFLNPPGGKDGNESVQKAWWFKLANEYVSGRVEAAIFVGFSIEILQTTQVDPKGILPLDFPFCVPSHRIAFTKASEQHSGAAGQTSLFGMSTGAPELESGKSPPHANVIVFLPPSRLDTRLRAIRQFAESFREIGAVVQGGLA